MDYGMIHGRFQPFTIGHMEYLKHVLNYVDRLVIGITNPEINRLQSNMNDDHRHLKSANPYTFYQRMRMIEESVKLDIEINDRYNDISIIPFYVEDIKLWDGYLPPTSYVQYINLFDSWDIFKKDAFEKYGYKTVDIGLPRIISATKVRQYMNEKNSKWIEMVPEGTRNIIKEMTKI